MHGPRRRRTRWSGCRRAGAVEALEPRALLAATLAAPAPAGDEFPVNTTTSGNQSAPAAAVAGDGTLVLAWQGPDAAGNGIYARRFDAGGAALGGEIVVTSEDGAAANQAAPAVAADGTGRFVVAWHGEGQDGPGRNVFARRFDAAGDPAGAAFPVNTLTDGNQSAPAVAADASGRFVVAWTDDRHDVFGRAIFARRFDAAGAPLDAADVPVSTDPYQSESSPAVAAAPGGAFVIAWEDFNEVGEYRVFARCFGADGAALGDEFQVTTGPSTVLPPLPSVAMTASGAFVVAWQAPVTASGDYGVYARAFDAGGAPAGDPFLVTTSPSTADLLPAVATAGDDGVLITWQFDPGDGSGRNVYARHHDLAGGLGAAFRANTTAGGDQSSPAAAGAVTSAGATNVVVAWDSAGQDGDGAGVYALRLTTAAANEAPTTSGIAPVSVLEDAPDITIGLFDAFADSSDPDSALVYSVADNTNPGLFRSTAIDPATGVLTLAPAPDASGAASITVRATDTGGLWVETTFPMTVSAVNDAPVNVVPPAQQTGAGTPLVFAAVHHNRIGVDDVDAGAGPLRVTLGATGGTLTLASIAGLTFTAGDGAADTSMTFTGTPTAINAALDGLRFDPAAGFSGAASLTVTSDDQGNSGAGGAKADTDTIAITVADELPPPAISIAGPASPVSEPDAGATADATFTVTLSEARPYEVSVRYATQDGAAGAGTAVAPADYAAASGTLIFAPGETSKTVPVAVAGDALDEVNEGFSVVLSNAAGGTIQAASAAAVIADNDPPPAVSIGDATVTEGTADAPVASALFPVTLSAPSGQRISIAYVLGVAGDTAGRFSDYTGRSDVLVFEPGETSKTVSLPIVPDALDEPDETFSVLLGFSASNYSVADGLGVATIVDDDPVPTIAINDATVVEGDTQDPLAVLTVRLSAPSGKAIMVRWHSQEATAVAGTTTAPGDYEPAAAILTFQPGEVEKTVQVRVKSDALDEADETLNLILYDPHDVTFADSRGIIRITDDDAPPGVAADDASVFEGDDPAGRLVGVTVRLLSPSGRAVTVNYATADGTAAAADYEAASGSITFAPGETSKTVDVRVFGDGAVEGDETFRLALTGADNAFVIDGGGVVTVREDDLARVIRVGDAGVTEGNAGATALAVFTITLSLPSGSPVTVDFATADGTATAGADYDAASGTITFAPGEMSRTVSVSVRGDATPEADETFSLLLSAPSGAALDDPRGDATIVDDDAPAPAPRVSGVFVSGSTWPAAFRQRLADLSLGSAAYGFALLPGPQQLATLPWSTIDTLSVRFDTDAAVQSTDLAVRGVNVPAYAIADFAYDPVTRTATWTLARPLGRDKVLLDLDGRAIDGEWGTGQAAFPSGDGAPGGDFEFRVNVLPGDADRGGRVDALDLWRVRNRLLTSTTRAGAGTGRYDVFHDVTADGEIDALDLLAVRRNQYQSLPSGQPSGVDPVAPASITRDLLFADRLVL